MESSLSYNEIEHIVEYLVKVKSHHHTFDCWDTEDIAQEIRIICLNALSEFDDSKAVDEKGRLNYFGRCVDNRLQNLKRDNYIRYNSKFEEISCTHGDPEYKKYEKYKTNLNRKRNIKHPVSIDSIVDASYFNEIDQELIADDIKVLLLTNITSELRPHLILMLNGDKKQVSSDIRKKIQNQVREIIAQNIADSEESS